MPFSYRDWIFGGKTFCCCLPVRFGVITMSVLGILVAGLLSIVLWFEVSADVGMTGGERAAFVLAALVETLLFIGSILGFTGAVIRKQSFLQTYAYFLYAHFFLNIAAAIYLGVMLSRFQDNANRVACTDTITNSQAQEQCQALLRVTSTVFIVVVAIVLFLEMYGAIIVTRYLNMVKREKRAIRESRRATDSAFSLRPLNRSFYEAPGETRIYSPLDQHYDEEFDPYADERGSSHLRSTTSTAAHTAASHSDCDDPFRPPIPIEEGYGGGSWTHRDISAEEKERLERAERSSVVIRVEDLSQEEMDRRRSEIKTPHGPTTTQDVEADSLPQYVAVQSPQVPAPVNQPPSRPEPGEPEYLLR